MVGGPKTEIWGTAVQQSNCAPTVHFASKEILISLPCPAEGRTRDSLPAHGQHEMLAEAAERKTNGDDPRFTLTFRPVASQQRNYGARGVIVPAAGGSLLNSTQEQNTTAEGATSFGYHRLQ